MLKTKDFSKVFVSWIPLAVAITGLALLAYLLVQQDLRQGANDPQIQVAEDISAQAATSGEVESYVPTSKVDVAKSLAPFIITYDDSGKETASSVQLAGKTPSLPNGIFTSTKKSGQERLTWQPKAGVRIAAVIQHFTGNQKGFILVGRSLAEVEKREELILRLATFGWILTLGLTLIVKIWIDGKVKRG